jgi:hypothetical protein
VLVLLMGLLEKTARPSELLASPGRKACTMQPDHQIEELVMQGHPNGSRRAMDVPTSLGAA